jgi:hypothetical protein
MPYTYQTYLGPQGLQLRKERGTIVLLCHKRTWHMGSWLKAAWTSG